MISCAYRIAGLSVRIDSEIPLRTHADYMAPFSAPVTENPDIRYLFRAAGDDENWGGLDFSPHRFNDFSVAEDAGWFYRRYEDGTVLKADKPGYCRLEAALPPEKTEAFDLIRYMAFETVILGFGGFFLHASIVDWKGNGILFTAPSGTGKSTQAALWEKHLGAATVNGDKALLRKTGGVWRAFGSAWSGSSGINRDESVPVRAVAVLRQHGENRLTRFGAADAIRHLLSETSLSRWSGDMTGKAVSMVSDLVSAAPVYLLECLPDEGAVEILRAAVEGGGSRA